MCQVTLIKDSLNSRTWYNFVRFGFKCCFRFPNQNNDRCKDCEDVKLHNSTANQSLTGSGIGYNVVVKLIYELLLLP